VNISAFILLTRCLAHVTVCVSSVCWSVWKMYCGKTADWNWMSFLMVSVVGRGMGVLDRVHVPEGEGVVLRGFSPHWFQWRICWTEIYRLVHENNISVWTICHWNLSFIDFPKIQSSSRSTLGFARNWQKCYNRFTKKSLKMSLHCMLQAARRCYVASWQQQRRYQVCVFLAWFGLLW